MFSCQKKTLGSSINHLRCFTKFLPPHILERISKLHDFTINFFAKEVALVTFSCPELKFSRNSADSAFSFWLDSSERKRRKREISGNFRLPMKCKNYCGT